MVHRIRLRGPWQWQRNQDQVRLVRAFHQPDGVDSLESIRLHLVLQPQIRLLALQLNGQALSAQLALSPEGASIDPRLSAYNQLQLDVVEEAEMAQLRIGSTDGKFPKTFENPWLLDAWLALHPRATK
jgi:hypothetical protein